MRSRRLLFLALSAALLMIGLGCSSAPALPGDPVAGEELYNTNLEESGGNACSDCHSLGAGSALAPSLKTTREKAADRIEGVSAEDYLRESIIDPQAYLVGNFPLPMPTGYADILTEDQINNLIAFILSE